jgi:hypothetical protein
MRETIALTRGLQHGLPVFRGDSLPIRTFITSVIILISPIFLGLSQGFHSLTNPMVHSRGLIFKQAQLERPILSVLSVLAITPIELLSAQQLFSGLIFSPLSPFVPTSSLLLRMFLFFFSSSSTCACLMPFILLIQT